MGEDAAFLRAVIASPDDATPRLVYADWLEERADPRAELLRSDWGVPRLSYVDWVANQGNLDYYLQTFPDLRSQVPEHEANRWWLNKLDALGAAINRDWVVVIDTLGRPFRPFFFWNNTGPRSYQEGQFPFREQIGARGSVITFESAFRGDKAWQPGLPEDLVFLRDLQLSECEYGAASCPVHPFICELEAGNRPLTGADVLRALKVADFRSQYIQSLDAPAIPYPGYHSGTDNDEIHNDPEGQCLFPRPEDVPEVENGDEADGPAARQGIHDALRGAVGDGRLWYVLLHSRAGLPPDGLDRGPWVILFAVGRSPRGDRLLGVVSHQMCHNLCD
jgi:uncharacterized protein (TIGR02996 family)